MSSFKPLLLKDFVRAEALSRSRRFTAKQVGRICGADRHIVAAFLDAMTKAGELSRVVVATLPIYTRTA